MAHVRELSMGKRRRARYRRADETVGATAGGSPGRRRLAKGAMKTIGLIGGMSWESSLHYYRLINEGVRARRGGLSSAQLILYSVDFAPIERMQAEGRWDDAGTELARVAGCVERGGADFLVLCTNTMHCVAERIEAAVSIPLVHIADATAAAVR